MLLEESYSSDQPLVTIIIPSYNHSAYVVDCIRSVINQDYENIELIIIDDGSNDDSVKIITDIADLCHKRFDRFEFRHRINKGLTETLNEGLQWAKGKYFSAIASDDIMLPHKTSVLVNSIVHDVNIAGVFGLCNIIDVNGSLIQRAVKPINCENVYYDFNDIFFRNYNICTPAQMLSVDLMRKIGGYPKDLYVEDYWAWLELTHKGYKLKKIFKDVVNYRLHLSNSHSNFMKMDSALLKILKKYSNEVGYNKAMSLHFLRSAIDISKTGSISFIYNFKESFIFYPKIIFNLNFYKVFIRSFYLFALHCVRN